MTGTLQVKLHRVLGVTQTIILSINIGTLLPLSSKSAKTRTSIKEAKDLPTRLLPPRLLVRHDAVGGRQDDVTELARGEQCDDPLLDLIDLHVESGGDDSALVEASVQLDYDLLRAVVIDNFEFTDVALMINSEYIDMIQFIYKGTNHGVG